MSLDFVWAQQLVVQYPQLFSFRALAPVSSPQYLEVASGQIWRASPIGATVNMYEDGGHRWCPGGFCNDNWAPTPSPPPVNCESAKLFVAISTQGIRAKLVLRPVLLLGSRIHRYGYCAAAPATKRAYHALPSLRVTHARGTGLLPSSDYLLSALIGSRTEIGADLLQFCTESRALTATAGAHPGEVPADAAARLLCEVLGLGPTTWVSQTKAAALASRARFRRGELVRIRFDSAQAPVPCLVVSPPVLNGQNLHHLIVVRTDAYHSEDENNDLALPIESPQLPSRRSLLFPLLYGIADEVAIVLPYDPVAVVTNMDAVYASSTRSTLDSTDG